MDYTTAAILCVAGMLFFLMLGVPIAYSLGFVSIIVGFFAFGSACLQKVGWMTFQLLFNLNWTPLPLFTLMACIIAETDIGRDVYLAARNWSFRIPGALVIASIFGEAGMAAATGSSSATILAVGKVAVPEFERYKYNKAASVSALLAGGVLGPLIPPSGTMIMYSVLTNVSLGRLFIAGLVPGIVLTIVLSLVTAILFRGGRLGGRAPSDIAWKERFSSLSKVWPVLLTGITILGSIYFGMATPTEAGGLGCFIILVIAVALFNFRFKHFLRAIREAAILNAMLFFIFVAAVSFTYVVGSSDAGKILVETVKSLNVYPIVIVLAIQLVLMILGCFIEGVTIMLITIPLFTPVISALDLSLLWFGILYVVNMEIALLTPPMGVNLFFVRNVFNIPTGELIKHMLPYFAGLIAFLLILLFVPDITTWLPGMMIKQ